MTLKELIAQVCGGSIYGSYNHRMACANLEIYKNILSEIDEYKEGVPAFYTQDGEELLICKSCADDLLEGKWKQTPYSDDPENYPVACEICHCIFSR